MPRLITEREVRRIDYFLKHQFHTKTIVRTMGLPECVVRDIGRGVAASHITQRVPRPNAEPETRAGMFQWPEPNEEWLDNPTG